MGVSEAFAGANERIAESAVRLGFSAPVPFLCECDDRRCYAIVRLPLAEYRRRRSLGEAVTIVGHAQQPAAVGRSDGPDSFGDRSRSA